MLLRAAAAVFLTLTLRAQDTSNADLIRMSDRLQSAIDAGDWKRAAELAGSLRGAVTDARDRAMNPANEAQIESFLKWLPEDTETIVVAHQPFTLSARKAPADALTGARMYVVGMLAEDDQEKPFGAFTGLTLRFAAIAARRFRNHDSNTLGMIAFQGCAVYAFARPLPEEALAGGETRVMGYRLWTSKAQQFQREGVEHLRVLLEPDVILACNDRDLLTTVLTRKFTPARTRALPQSLPEWKHIDRSASLWGLRHFSRDAGKDPTHPWHENFLGIRDNEAAGVVVHVNSPNDIVSARWLSNKGDDPWTDLASDADFNGKATTRKTPDGIWEISAPTQGSAASFAVFAFMSYLGFAVVI